MKKGWFILFIPAITMATPLILLIFIPVMIAGALDEHGGTVNVSDDLYYIELKEVDMQLWNENFKKANALSDYGDYFLEYAELFNIDPIVLVAISMKETNWGVSREVRENNNPGVYSEDNEDLRFETLEEGIKMMALKLGELINDEGLVTINDLGNKYAPIDVEDGSEELNRLWVPDVLEIVEEFGGLTRQYAFSGDLDTIDEMVWVTPYTKRVTSGFRTSKRPNHNGIDIASPGIRGTPVLALTEGVVTISDANGTTFESDASDYRNGRSKGYGWYVEVDHGDGFKTRYAHLIEQGVPVGTEVKAGQIIGYVGSTGASTAPHLHFETIINGNFVDPMGIVGVFLEEET